MKNPFSNDDAGLGGLEASSGPPTIPDHQLLRRIGQGSYGEVWLAKSVLGAYRAVKIVYRRTFQHDRPYEREFNGIQKFEPLSRSHEGLVDILQVGRNDADGYFYYVMELADDEVCGQDIRPGSYEPRTLGRDVSSRARLPFDQWLKLSLSLTSAVGHLHEHGLIHRDIKPSNIIFVNGVPKLADIGLVTDAGSPTIPGGTIGYIAPEGIPSAQADLYSLGKVLYEVCTGKDRLDFPDLPTHLEGEGEQTKLAEINEVILRACEVDIHKRYQAATELRADLVLLDSGKSVKRLRILERRLALFTKAAVGAAALVLITAAGFYQAQRARKAATLRLASAYVAYGNRSMEDGDLFGSLPWFTEALRLHAGHTEQIEQDRVRLAVALRQCPRIVRMWPQDTIVNHLEFSPDGRYLVTAGVGGEVMVWDVDKDTLAHRLVGHDPGRGVESASYSRDGRFIATASGDHTVRIWDAQTGREAAQPLLHDRAVYGARFSPDGSHVVTVNGGGRAQLWDLATSEAVVQFEKHRQLASDVAISPDGRRVVTSSHDATAQVWDMATGAPSGPTLRHEGPIQPAWVYRVAFSPDGRFLLTASFDNAARLWDAETGLLIRTFEHEAGVRSAAFSPDGRLIVTACWDFAARLWDAKTGRLVGPPLKHSSYLKDATFSPEGRRIATATIHGVVCVWDFSPCNWVPQDSTLQFSPDGERFVSRGSKVVEVRDARTSNSVAAPLKLSKTVSKLLLNRDATRILTLATDTLPWGRETTVAQSWNVATGQAISPAFSCSLSISNEPQLVTKVWLDDAGRRLVTVVRNFVQLWDAIQGRPFSPPLEHAQKVEQAVFNSQGTRLATVSGRRAFVWNTTNGQRMLELTHTSSVSHVEFSPDGRFLGTTCADATLLEREGYVWEVKTGRRLGQPLPHRDGVLWISFSPDSRRVVTASEDFTAQVWDWMTGRRITAPLKHRHEVFQASYSADARWIVTTSRDNTARVWDAETGEPFTPPLTHILEPSWAQFITRGRRVVTGRSSGESWLWDLLPDARPAEDLALMAQLLSQHRTEQTGASFPLSKETLKAYWLDLRSRYPADFMTSPEEALAWHEREVRSAERARQWFAVLFHLDRLLEAKPQDARLLERKQRAQARLTERPTRNQ